jgi:hypothetical protein
MKMSVLQCQLGGLEDVLFRLVLFVGNIKDFFWRNRNEIDLQ